MFSRLAWQDCLDYTRDTLNKERHTVNLTDLRSAFWETFPKYAARYSKTHRARVRQNSYPVDIRMTWCDFVDMMHRDGLISDSLANRATL